MCDLKAILLRNNKSFSNNFRSTKNGFKFGWNSSSGSSSSSIDFQLDSDRFLGSTVGRNWVRTQCWKSALKSLTRKLKSSTNKIELRLHRNGLNLQCCPMVFIYSTDFRLGVELQKGLRPLGPDEFQFTLLSYNILSDKLMKGHPELYTGRIFSPVQNFKYKKNIYFAYWFYNLTSCF